jgi:hypothetical protein
MYTRVGRATRRQAVESKSEVAKSCAVQVCRVDGYASRELGVRGDLLICRTVYNRRSNMPILNWRFNVLLLTE